MAVRYITRQDRGYNTKAHSVGTAATQAGDQPKCQSFDPELWFPIGEVGPSNAAVIEQAKAVCVECPLRVGCLDFAIEHRISDGIWGGMTPSERARVIRQKEAGRAALAS